MAHHHNDRPVTQVLSTIDTSRSEFPADNVLRHFAEYAVALRNILYDDGPLEEGRWRIYGGNERMCG